LQCESIVKLYRKKGRKRSFYVVTLFVSDAQKKEIKEKRRKKIKIYVRSGI